MSARFRNNGDKSVDHFEGNLIMTDLDTLESKSFRARTSSGENFEPGKDYIIKWDFPLGLWADISKDPEEDFDFSFDVINADFVDRTPTETRVSVEVNFPDFNLDQEIRLQLNQPDIKNITRVAELTNLTGLSIIDVPLPSPPVFLEPLINLTRMKLMGTGIDTLENMPDFPKLEELIILEEAGQGEISDLTPLEGMTQLVVLSVSGHQVQNLQPLEGLINIQQFNLQSNQIEDIQPLINNTGLGINDAVVLFDNPLNFTAQCVHIPEFIMSRFMKVFFDPTIDCNARKEE